MSKLLVEAKAVVIPGEILAEGMDHLPGKGAFREGEKVIASRVGLVYVNGSIINIVPLSGRYIPKKDDTVIGYVRDMTYSSWFINIGYAYDASLSLKDASSSYIERGASLSDFYAVSDAILTRITNVTKDLVNRLINATNVYFNFQNKTDYCVNFKNSASGNLKD